MEGGTSNAGGRDVVIDTVAGVSVVLAVPAAGLTNTTSPSSPTATSAPQTYHARGPAGRRFDDRPWANPLMAAPDPDRKFSPSAFNTGAVFDMSGGRARY